MVFVEASRGGNIMMAQRDTFTDIAYYILNQPMVGFSENYNN